MFVTIKSYSHEDGKVQVLRFFHISAHPTWAATEQFNQGFYIISTTKSKALTTFQNSNACCPFIGICTYQKQRELKCGATILAYQ